MRTINYNFQELLDDCENVIIHTNNSNLLELKKSLNKFFKDSTCIDLIVTHNDSLFFGMCVTPIVDKDLINAIIQDDKSVRFNKYTIEIDSKLFNPVLDITPKEFLAMLLHEVGHIVNDPTPVEQVRDAINIGLAKKGDTLNVPKSVQYASILSYGIKSTIRKLNSMFFIYKNGEVLADEFVHACGYGEELNSAFNKICKSGMKINDDVNKLTALTWTLSLYKDVKLKRIPALRLLKKMKSITGSQTEKKEMEILEKSLYSIDDMSLEESYDFNSLTYYIESSVGDAISRRKTKFAQLRSQTTEKSLKQFENDIYEYSMRVRHIATEEDALYLMRQINIRISVIEDYLDRERLTESQQKKWWSLLEKYMSIREKLAKDVHYAYDYSGSVIQVNYPDIVQDRY
jgi:hypothetical protein